MLSAGWCACNGEVRCADLTCKEGELCIYLGSDTSDPGKAKCYALPAACTNNETCSCLQGQRVDNINMDFCTKLGGCEKKTRLEVICPGG